MGWTAALKDLYSVAFDLKGAGGVAQNAPSGKMVCMAVSINNLVLTSKRVSLQDNFTTKS